MPGGSAGVVVAVYVCGGGGDRVEQEVYYKGRVHLHQPGHGSHGLVYREGMTKGPLICWCCLRWP